MAHIRKKYCISRNNPTYASVSKMFSCLFLLLLRESEFGWAKGREKMLNLKLHNFGHYEKNDLKAFFNFCCKFFRFRRFDVFD